MLSELDIMGGCVISSVQVIGLGWELCSESINPLDPRLNSKSLSPGPNQIFSRVNCLGDLLVAEARFLRTHDHITSKTVETADVTEFIAEVDYILKFVKEPVVDFGKIVNLFQCIVFVEHCLSYS